MKNQNSRILLILLIVSVFVNIKGKAVVRKGGQCSCEQILYEEECLINTDCQFKNNKCTTIPCESYSEDNCNILRKCALVNDKCVKFESCSSHNAKTKIDCQRLHLTCQFNEIDQTCKDIKDLYGTCSESLLSGCLQAKEGNCVIKDGKCQQMTSCDDANQDLLRCILALPACFPNPNDTTMVCETIDKCSRNSFNICYMAQEKINSSNMLLCSQTSNGCADFDPSIQTQETCALKSVFYYHWEENQCTRCNSNSFIITIFTIVILAFNS